MCKVDGCRSKARAKDLHYRRRLCTGPTEERKPKVCRTVACNRPTHADDRCMTHNQAKRRMKIRNGDWKPNQYKESQ